MVELIGLDVRPMKLTAFLSAVAAIALAAPTAIAQPDGRIFNRSMYWQGCHEDYENIRAFAEGRPSGQRALDAIEALPQGASVADVIAAMPQGPDTRYYYTTEYSAGQLNFTGSHANGNRWQIQVRFIDPNPAQANVHLARMTDYSVIVEGGNDGNCEWRRTF